MCHNFLPEAVMTLYITYSLSVLSVNLCWKQQKNVLGSKNSYLTKLNTFNYLPYSFSFVEILEVPCAALIQNLQLHIPEGLKTQRGGKLPSIYQWLWHMKPSQGERESKHINIMLLISLRAKLNVICFWIIVYDKNNLTMFS